MKSTLKFIVASSFIVSTNSFPLGRDLNRCNLSEVDENLHVPSDGFRSLTLPLGAAPEISIEELREYLETNRYDGVHSPSLEDETRVAIEHDDVDAFRGIFVRVDNNKRSDYMEFTYSLVNPETSPNIANFLEITNQ